MRKILEFLTLHKYFVLLCLLIIPSFMDVIRPGLYSMHDDIQAFRVHQMDKCIREFQIPCRWVPDMGLQYGYPQFNFYPPSIYYLGEVFHLIGFGFIDSIKIIVALGFITAAFAMYKFLKDLLGELPALVGALLYTYTPYKAVNPYVRGALSEFWALTFYPLIFWSIYKLIKTNQLRYALILALSGGGLLITHNLMPVIFAPLAIVWTLLWIILEKNFKVIPKIIFGGLLGVGLAAFFILPVSMERNFVHVESVLSGYFDYRRHFVDIDQLFFSTFWGYGSSEWGPYDGLSLSTGTLQWIIGLVSIFLALVKFKKYPKLSLTVLLFSGVELFVLFMTHQKSSFIWSQIPFLAYLQFPWRLLSDSIFILALLGAIAIYFIEQTELKVKRFQYVWVLVGAIIIGLFVLYGSYFKGHAWKDISDQEKFSGQSWNKQLTISIFDYLPIYAELPPTKVAPDKPEIMDGSGEVEVWYKGSNWQWGRVVAFGESTLRLPLFDFPGMEVSVDGKVIEHRHDDCRGQEFCLGLISFNIPQGEHEIAVKLHDTPVRRVGNIVSLISIITLGLFAIKINFKKINKSKNKK